MNFKALRILLISSFLILSILPLSGVAYRIEREGEKMIRAKVTSHLSGLAEKSASYLDIFLAERIFDLRLFSYLILSEDPPDAETARKVFSRMQKLSGVYLDFFFFDPEGKPFLSSRPYDSSIRRLVTDRIDLSSQSGYGQGFVSSICNYPAAGSHIPAVLTAVALSGPDGRNLGVAVTAVDFRPIEDYFRKTRIDRTGEVYLIDRQGGFLTVSRLGAQPFRDRIGRANEPGSLPEGLNRDTDYRGQQVFRAWKESRRTPWIVIAEQDRAESLREIKLLRREIFIVTAVFSLAILFISWIVSDRIVRFLEKSYRHEKELEFQTIQKSKLAAIGMLTSGLAHELNTPLASALLYTQILKEDCQGEENRTPYEHLSIIEEEIRQCSHIVRNLLDVARVSHGEPASSTVGEVLEKVLAISNARIKAGRIQVVKRINPGLPPVRIGESVIQEVFTNLIANALDAMPDGGTLTIASRHVPVLEKVVTEIGDTGKGIAAENLGKLFEPFFTTKQRGEGTGLGLFMSHEIVRRHGGNLRVISTPASEDRHGTTMFAVELPIAGTETETPGYGQEA